MKPKILFDRYISRKNFYQSISEADPNLNKFINNYMRVNSYNNCKTNQNMIDENTLTFVALHELSHLATKSIGHNDEFWNNFKFLITQASIIQIYTPIDYKKQKQEYCGMNIKDNPYFDS